jgi:hypothetical protein
MRRLRLGEWVAAVAGVALVVSLFMTWYEPTAANATPLGAPNVALSAFESFSILDLYLVLVALAGIGLAVLQVTQRSPAVPVGAGVLTTLLGAIAVLLVAYRMVNQPGDNEFVEVRAGAWVALVAALGVTLGAWLSLREEDVRGLPPGPEPELRPPPA